MAHHASRSVYDRLTEQYLLSYQDCYGSPRNDVKQWYENARVQHEATPVAAPKKEPSNTLTATLWRTFCLISSCMAPSRNGYIII